MLQHEYKRSRQSIMLHPHLGRETVTVTAGTFDTCKFQVTGLKAFERILDAASGAIERILLKPVLRGVFLLGLFQLVGILWKLHDEGMTTGALPSDWTSLAFNYPLS